MQGQKEEGRSTKVERRMQEEEEDSDREREDYSQDDDWYNPQQRDLEKW